jgi:hypothetical protein
MSDDRACGGDDDDQLDRQAPVGSEDAGGDQPPSRREQAPLLIPGDEREENEVAEVGWEVDECEHSATARSPRG